MSNFYFSERELGEKPRTETEIPQRVWTYLVATINQFIDNGAFGNHFPDRCPDNDGGVYGTDTQLFSQVLFPYTYLQ